MTKKVIYFTAGPVPTTAEKAEIDNLNDLANAYDIQVRNAVADNSFGGDYEDCDLVAGSVPNTGFTQDEIDFGQDGKPVLFEAFPKTPSLGTGETAQLVCIATTGTILELEGEDVTASCTFASSATGKATVSASGLITRIAAGTANVTVTYEYSTGKTVTFVVAVTTT